VRVYIFHGRKTTPDLITRNGFLVIKALVFNLRNKQLNIQMSKFLVELTMKYNVLLSQNDVCEITDKVVKIFLKLNGVIRAIF